MSYRVVPCRNEKRDHWTTTVLPWMTENKNVGRTIFNDSHDLVESWRSQWSDYQLIKGVVFFLVCAGFAVLGIATGHYLWKDPAGWDGQSVAMGKSKFLNRSAAPSSKNNSRIVQYIITEKWLFSTLKPVWKFNFIELSVHFWIGLHLNSFGGQ